MALPPPDSTADFLAPADTALLTRTTESPLISAPDLLVIGAELTGLALASMAVEKGWKVQVIGDAPLTDTNSSRLPGLIWPSSLAGKCTDAEREFAFYCRDLWSRLTVRPRMEFEWKVPGIVALGGATGIPAWSDRIDDLQADGWSIQGVDHEQLQSLLPGWNRNADRGVFFPADGQINPLKATLSFARNIIARESSLRTGVPLELNCSISEGKLTQVKTPLGELCPRHLLINDGSLPERFFAEYAQPVETLKRTTLRGFVPLSSPLCHQPVISNQTTIIPRNGGCEIFHNMDQPAENAAEQLQLAWNETVSCWSEAKGAGIVDVSQFSQTLSADLLPRLEQIREVENVWWTLPNSHDILLAAGMAQRLLEWMQSRAVPPAVEFLQR